MIHGGFGVAVAALIVVPLAVSIALIVNRERIVKRQKAAAFRKFGRLGQGISERMTTSQVVVGAIALSLLGAINVIGFISSQR